jgi:hypothetical protein
MRDLRLHYLDLSNRDVDICFCHVQQKLCGKGGWLAFSRANLHRSTVLKEEARIE